jgi:hypothetical protein
MPRPWGNGRRVVVARGGRLAAGRCGGKTGAPNISWDGLEKCNSDAASSSDAADEGVTEFRATPEFRSFCIGHYFQHVRSTDASWFADGHQGANCNGGAESPWAETLGVYVDGLGQFYVNGRAVAREDLRAKLQEELGRRAVWTVYFEANEDCTFMNATYTFDTIQGLGAKVVWITPRIRQELNRKDAP